MLRLYKYIDIKDWNTTARGHSKLFEMWYTEFSKGSGETFWQLGITNCLCEKEFIIIMVYKVSARRSLVERRIGQKVSYLTRSEQDRLTSGPNVLLGFLKDRETGFWEQELIRFGWGVVSRPCFYNFAFFLLHQVTKLIVKLICMFVIVKIFKTLSEG